jgi:hypothetical protein
MNENSLKNLKPFQPGNKFGGATKLPQELRDARRKNMANLIKLIHLYVSLTDEQAKERLSGPSAVQLESMIQGQINKASEGDSRAFQFIIEVMCGKIPESDDTDRLSDTMTPQEKLEAAKKMVQMLERDINASGSTE